MSFYICQDCGTRVDLEPGYAHGCAKPSDPTFALAVIEMRCRVLEEERDRYKFALEHLFKAYVEGAPAMDLAIIASDALSSEKERMHLPPTDGNLGNHVANGG